jgi:hypothetical protein
MEEKDIYELAVNCNNLKPVEIENKLIELGYERTSYEDHSYNVWITYQKELYEVVLFYDHFLGENKISLTRLDNFEKLI